MVRVLRGEMLRGEMLRGEVLRGEMTDTGQNLKTQQIVYRLRP